jgi:hypothetical protein
VTKLCRITAVTAIAAASVLASAGAATAAPTCVGAISGLKGSNEAAKVRGFKNAGDSASSYAQQDGGLGHLLPGQLAGIRDFCASLP